MLASAVVLPQPQRQAAQQYSAGPVHILKPFRSVQLRSGRLERRLAGMSEKYYSTRSQSTPVYHCRTRELLLHEVCMHMSIRVKKRTYVHTYCIFNGCSPLQYLIFYEASRNSTVNSGAATYPERSFQIICTLSNRLKVREGKRATALDTFNAIAHALAEADATVAGLVAACTTRVLRYAQHGYQLFHSVAHDVAFAFAIVCILAFPELRVASCGRSVVRSKVRCLGTVK